MGYQTRSKYIGSTQYKYVSEVLSEGKCGSKTKFQICILGVCRQFDTLKEAAIAVDKILILNGKKPVNILKPKPKE